MGAQVGRIMAYWMQRTGSENSAEAILPTPSRVRIVVLLPALICLAFGGFIQGQIYLNHDVAWVLSSSERLLAGGTFGHDIVAANPPLIWWISALVAGLANGLGLDPILMLRLAVLALTAVVLVVMERNLRQSTGHAAMSGLLALLALLFTLGVHRDFAQREHLSVLLVLPWLVVSMRRADDLTQSRCLAVVAGVAAGIGIAFKPHFLAVPALVWLYITLHRRSLRPALGVETFALLLTGIGYILAVWLFARPYLTEVIPQITQVYWGFEYSLENVIRTHSFVIAMGFVACIVAFVFGTHSLPRLTSLAGLGFLIAALAQSKGYSYHFYPVLAFAIISLAFSALTAGERMRRLLSAALLVAGLIFSTLQAGPSLAYRAMNGAYGQVTTCLVGLTEANVPVGGGFMAISTHPYPGFPVANYSHRRWVAATNSRLFLPAILRLNGLPELTVNQAQTLALAETAERAAILKDLSHRPALVLLDARPHRHAIETSDIDFLTFYGVDPAFDQIWQSYQEIPSCAPGIRAFTLSEGN